MGYDFRFDVVFDQWPWILQGLAVTLAISTIPMALALVVGLAVALLTSTALRPLRVLADFYVQVFRFTIARGLSQLERRLHIPGF